MSGMIHSVSGHPLIIQSFVQARLSVGRASRPEKLSQQFISEAPTRLLIFNGPLCSGGPAERDRWLRRS